jgi:hypothetical protein
VTWRVLHFDVLRCRPALDDEELKLRRSFCNNIASVLELITLKILVSSAKAATFEFTMEEDRSLVYKRKSSGPRMEPCGTQGIKVLLY